MLATTQPKRPAKARRHQNRALIVARLRQGMTPNALARRAAITGNTVLKAERGEYISPHSQHSIAAALSVDDVLTLFPFERQRESR